MTSESSGLAVRFIGSFEGASLLGEMNGCFISKEMRFLKL